VGFLNAKTGGILLIGVDDDSNILGLEKDYATLGRKNRDGFQQALVNILAEAIGDENTSKVDVTFEELDGKDVCMVKAPPSNKPVHARVGEDEKFFVRIQNTTRELNAKQYLEYARTRWPGLVA
jgi:predicted HTH transcriptional regulator